MALFEWTESFSVGVEYFDEQHRRLVGLLNDLHEAMRVGRAADALNGIFQSLIEYTGYHFSDEEKTMARCGFPGLESHRREHELLTEKVLAFRKKFENKEILLSIELLEFLKTWLAHHILETDKQYGPALKGLRRP